MTKIIWTKDDFLIEDNILVSLSKEGKEKLNKTTTLEIPEGISEIKNYAFDGCRFKEVVLPSSLLCIGDGAFYNTGLRRVIGGENVEEVGRYSFKRNLLTKFPDFKNIKVIKAEAFSLNWIRDFEVPRTLKKIEDEAFRNNILTSLDFRRTKKLMIDTHAFLNNDIKEVHLNDDTFICNDSFEGNVIETITGLGDSKENLYNSLKPEFKEDFEEEIVKSFWDIDDFYSVNGSIGGLTEKGIRKAYKLGYVYLPKFDDFDSIEQFNPINSSFKTLYIEEGYTEIKTRAFLNSCYEYIKLPTTLKKLGNKVFYYSKLKYIKIPKNVTSIGSSCFLGSEIVKADFSECKIKMIRKDMFYSTKNLMEVLLPESIEKIGSDSFRETTRLKRVEIPKNVISIEKNAFFNSGLEEVVFNNDFPIYIESCAFAYSKLKSIKGENLSFRDINEQAFHKTNLKELVIEKCYFLNTEAFMSTPITRVEIKDAHTILDGVFYNSLIKSVKLGGEVSIKGDAFSVNEIESLEFFEDAKIKLIGEKAFRKNKLKSLHLGENVEKVNDSAFLDNPLEDFSMSENTEICTDDYYV